MLPDEDERQLDEVLQGLEAGLENTQIACELTQLSLELISAARDSCCDFIRTKLLATVLLTSCAAMIEMTTIDDRFTPNNATESDIAESRAGSWWHPLDSQTGVTAATGG